VSWFVLWSKLMKLGQANVEVVKGATKWYKSYPQILSYLLATS
jgi:hypothetical protein